MQPTNKNPVSPYLIHPDEAGLADPERLQRFRQDLQAIQGFSQDLQSCAMLERGSKGYMSNKSIYDVMYFSGSHTHLSKAPDLISAHTRDQIIDPGIQPQLNLPRLVRGDPQREVQSNIPVWSHPLPSSIGRACCRPRHRCLPLPSASPFVHTSYA